MLNEFPDFPGKEFLFYLLGNGNEVQSFVANESKSDKSPRIPALFFEIYKPLNGAPEKKTYAIWTKTKFPLLQLMQDRFKKRYI